MKNRKIAFIAGVIFVLLCAALYIFIYTIPEITGALKKTVVVEYGSMRISETVPAYIVREETVYQAEYDGNITYYVENNQKTRRGYKILDIYGSDNHAVTCPVTGVISFYYDGYEGFLTPDTLENLLSIAPRDSEIVVSQISKETVAKGDPIYKVITSDTWYIVGIIPNDNLEKYSEGASITVEFESGDIQGAIKRIVQKEEQSLVIVSTSKYFAEYDKLRQCTVNFVLRDDKGLMVPNSAISMYNGETGVYVKRIDGEYDFTPIKVINSDENNSVVYADTYSVLRSDGLTDTVKTISIYDEILKNAPKQN